MAPEVRANGRKSGHPIGVSRCGHPTLQNTRRTGEDLHSICWFIRVGDVLVPDEFRRPSKDCRSCTSEAARGGRAKAKAKNARSGRERGEAAGLSFAQGGSRPVPSFETGHPQASVAIHAGEICVFRDVVAKEHATEASRYAQAEGHSWKATFQGVPPWTEQVGPRLIDRAPDSIKGSDRMMTDYHVDGVIGARVLELGRTERFTGDSHSLGYANLMKGGSVAQPLHKDDDGKLACFNARIAEDGTLPYHLAVLVAFEEGTSVLDSRGKEVAIPLYGAAVWRGDTSHAGNALNGDCLRGYFHVVHEPSLQSVVGTGGGIFPPFSVRDAVEMGDVKRALEVYPGFREALRCAKTSRSARDKLVYYVGAGEQGPSDSGGAVFERFAEKYPEWHSELLAFLKEVTPENPAPESESEPEPGRFTPEFESEFEPEPEPAEQAPESTSVPQGELAPLMAERFGTAWVSVAKWDNNSCHLDTVLDVVRFLHMCEVPSVTLALTTTTAHPWERVRGAIAVHLEERSTDGGRRVSSDVIDAIHGTVCGRRGRRGKHLNAGENMKVVADNLVRPHAKGWLSKVSCCSRCKRAGKAVEEHAEWSYPVSGQDCVELPSDDDDDGGGGGTTTALRLVDRIQGLVSGAAAGSGDSETANPKLCTSCKCGVVQRRRAVTGEAPEFFVLRAEHPSESSERRDDGGMRINFGGKKTLKFPRHQGEEGDPPQGVYRALCRVEHNRRRMHYITKVNIGVMLHHDSDEWYSYDATGSPRVARTEEEGFGSEQCFAVFVNMASVALKEDVVDVSKSLHRVEEHRKSVNAEEVTGSVVGARTGARTRGRARKV